MLTYYKRTFKVCDRCNTAYYHPLKYCLHCPGKIVERTVDFPTYPQPVAGEWELSPEAKKEYRAAKKKAFDSIGAIEGQI